MKATTLFGLLMMHVGAASIQSCLFLPNVELHGGTVDEFRTVNIKDCCMACSANTCCVAYTYDTKKKRCYLKSAIGHSTENTETTSGLKPNARFGKSVVLNNVKIVGDQQNRIELRNQDECRQYCTAYQVFTFTPPEEEDNAGNGECTCTMRIKSLRYAFGCLSEINPPSA